MMDFCNIPDVKKFDCPDDFVKAVFSLPVKENHPGTIRQLRALAASIGINDVMKLRREQLVPQIYEKIGWEKFSEEIGNIGVSRNRFYELGIDKESFDQMIDCGEIRISGSCRYTGWNRVKFCPIYNAYDYFRIKNEMNDK